MSLLIKNWQMADWKELLQWAKIGANNAMIGEFTEVEEVQAHGRLIDADALWAEINKICDRRDAGIITDLNCIQQLLSAARLAPTIIPAEDGET